MNTNRIDFISAYCDRRCGRCAFTDRCSGPVGEELPDTAGDRAPLNRMARTYMMRSIAWLDEHRQCIFATADSLVHDASEIVGWDASLIGAKLHRALDGRDRFCDGEDEGGGDPVQNDWNGSAKVALILIGRSEAAWRVIARATGDRGASSLADAVGHLRRIALDEFPDAHSFVRPGFDEVSEP